jgi:hypothetical protein
LLQRNQTLKVLIKDEDDITHHDLIYDGTQMLPGKASKSKYSSQPYSIRFKGNYVTLDIIVKIYCNPGYLVPDCETFCLPRNDSKGHLSCDYENGTKTCLPGWFAVETNCTRYCVPQNSEQGHYNCSETGEKLCLNHWYGDDCTVYCKEHSNLTFYCNKTNGEKICRPDWYGNNCSTYCKKQDNLSGHFRCDNISGQKVCNPHWYEANCKILQRTK